MFQCSSASRKFLNSCTHADPSSPSKVSVLFSEPKISQFVDQPPVAHRPAAVSVLFSEPKISQSFARRPLLAPRRVNGFSALQRAENFSMIVVAAGDDKLTRFQCSSASRKFLNSSACCPAAPLRSFQCSSASRKFLNSGSTTRSRSRPKGFSALQRAENFSILFAKFLKFASLGFSALQRAENFSICTASESVSPSVSFSALQRAENFSIPTLAPASIHIPDRDDHASSFLSLPGVSL